MRDEKRGSFVSEAVVEMARLVRGAAAPAVAGETVPHAIARAARRLGLSKGRVKAFWYGEAKTAFPDELERARDVALRRSKDIELLRAEHRRAVDILARLEAGFAAMDADFFSAEIDAARALLRQHGPEDMPGD